jgi:energy-coupling factor transporter ATP-binding protein EcfA2
LKLITLELDRLPGIPRPFVLDGFGGGATLIHGPNASGKSSTRRALKQLLFEPESDPEIALTAHFEDEHGSLRANLSRGKVTWFRGSKEVARPSLPPRGRADSFAVGVRELLDDGGDAERGFAQAVARQMTQRTARRDLGPGAQARRVGRPGARRGPSRRTGASPRGRPRRRA